MRTGLVSKVPSDKITESCALFESVKAVFAVSSTVIPVVEPATILPPLRIFAFTGSDICIICPHLINTPASAVAVNVTVSVAFCSWCKNHLPNLLL